MPDRVVCVSQKLLIWDSHAQASLELTENGVERKKTSSEQQVSGQKCLNERGQRRRAGLVEADRKVTVMEIYKHGMPKIITAHKTHQTSKRIGHSSRLNKAKN